MWASHKLLFRNLDLRKEALLGTQGTGQQRDAFGGWGELQPTLVTGLVCMGSKVISTCQLVDMIYNIILGGALN